jgi:endonuclease/exonuclease/phosphatase family metal-dependent hydrolase
VTHNVYWLQGSPSLWGDERSQPHDDVLQALIDLYRSLAPDVLCLQEVSSPDVVEALCDALDLNGQHASGGQRPEYGGAVLWRTDAEGVPSDHAHTPVTEDRVFERICQLTELTLGGRRRSLVNLHLASNRYAPQRRGEPLRLAELEAALATVPDADVVAGDFNARTDSLVHERMVTAGFEDVCADGSLPVELEERRIDYIWLRRDAGLRATDARILHGDELALGGHPEVSLSDHPALCVDLETTR